MVGNEKSSGCMNVWYAMSGRERGVYEIGVQPVWCTQKLCLTLDGILKVCNQ